MKDVSKHKKFVKIFVITGFSLALLLLMISFAIQIISHSSDNYYLLNEMSIELIHTSRKCAGVTALGASLISLVMT